MRGGWNGASYNRDHLTSALALPLLDHRGASDREGAGRRVLAFAIALSLLVHGAAVLEWWPRLDPTPAAPEADPSPLARAPLTASLVEPKRPVETEPAPAPPPPVAAATALKPRPPILLAERSPIPSVRLPDLAPIPPAQPLRPVPGPETARPAPLQPDTSVTPAYPDLAAYVAARRRARGESEAASQNPSEDETARRNRIVAANLASINTPTFGAESRTSGGMFQITQLGVDAAEFTFFGWNRDIKRRGSQRIDVRRGQHADIRLAVVRRMIAIIREYEQEDFTWRSNRLGRDVTLSARAADNEGLEQFMLREFFELSRAPG